MANHGVRRSKERCPILRPDAEELQQCGTQGVTVLLRMLQLQLQYADATFQRDI